MYLNGYFSNVQCCSGYANNSGSNFGSANVWNNYRQYYGNGSNRNRTNV